MKDPADNLYTGLKTLFWGAFVGIVSFQILGPSMATAIHRQLGWSEAEAYSCFSKIYILLPSFICLFFIVREFHLFKKYLSPFGEQKMDWLSKMLLWGVIGLWIKQVIVTCLFLFPHWNWADFDFFHLMFRVDIIVCIGLMVFGGMLTYLKFSATKNTSRSDRGFFIQLLLTCLVIHALSGMFVIHYVDHNGRKTFLSYEAPNQGFTLLQRKGSLEDGLKQVAHIIEKIRLQVQLDSVGKGADSIPSAIADSARKRSMKKPAQAPKPNLKFAGIFNQQLLEVYQAAVNVVDEEDLLYHDLQKLDGLKDTTTKLKYLDLDTAELFEHENKLLEQIDTLNAREKNLPDTPGFAMDTLSPLTKAQVPILRMNYGKYLRNVQLLTNYLATDLDKSIKGQIGDQLRYTQLIGTPILLGLFLSLISLYIFLNMNTRLTGKGLNELKIASRRLPPVSAPHQRKEHSIISKEEETDEANVLSNNIWLFITIVVWLLVAFFKPIDDDKIDLADPFKTLTLSGSENPFGNGSKGGDDGPCLRRDSIQIIPLMDSLHMLPYIKDTIIKTHHIEYDTVYHIYQLDTVGFGEQFKQINERLDYLVPPKK